MIVMYNNTPTTLLLTLLLFVTLLPIVTLQQSIDEDNLNFKNKLSKNLIETDKKESVWTNWSFYTKPYKP